MDFTQYIRRLKKSKCSHTTIEDYTNTFTRFFERFDVLNEKTISAFLDNVKPSTATKYRIQLRGLANHERIPIDWEREVPEIKVYRELPISITREHQEKIVDYLTSKHSKLYGDVFRFIIETGLRISEVTALTEECALELVDGKRGVMIYKGAGGTSHSQQGRFVPFSAMADRIVRRHGLPFKIERRRLNDALVKARKDLDLPHYKLHTARKTFCTRQSERGVSIEFITKTMGHEDPKTTLRYISSQPEVVSRAFHNPTRQQA